MLWSTVVSSVRDDFRRLADRWNITSAYRKLDHLSSGNPHEDKSPCDSEISHETVLLFENPEKRTISELVTRDDHYEQLLSRIRAGRVCTTNADHHLQRLRFWLGTPSETINDINHQRNLQHYHPDTGRWLFEDPTFRDWARPEGDVSFLWLTGPEGCGKSTLALQAAERIAATELRYATPRLMLSLDKPQSEYQLTASLASQLLSYVLDHAGGVDRESLFILDQRHNKLPGVQALIRLLIAQCPAVFVFVDGIDDIPADQEEDEGTTSDEEITSDGKKKSDKKHNKDKKKKVGRARRHVYSTLAFLSGLVTKSAGTGSPVRLWCSSARTAFVQDWLGDFEATELRVDLALVAKDIADYVDHQMDKMKPSLSMPEKSNFLDRIGSNFLLARWALEYSEYRGYSMTDWASSNFSAVASEGLNAFHRARLAEIQRQQSADDNNLAR
jgi:energy-coupling factor transporter ATP-binding protein EcfA2